MPRNAHDNTGAVAHEDIVRNEHRNDLARRGVDDFNAVEPDAGLVVIQFAALEVGFSCRRLLIRLDVRPVLNQRLPLFEQRMLRRNDGIRHAEERIDTGRVDRDVILGVGLEGDLGAGRPADPVFLLGLDALNVVQPRQIQIVNQAVCILCDAQHPLALFLADHRRAAALAHALDDLFVCQHALAARAPVDGHRGLIGKPVLVHLQENPLRPLIILGVRRVDNAVPVEAVAEHLELTGEVFDVLLRHNRRMDVVLDGEVLGRQTEGVKADGVEDIIALHALFAADDIHRRKGSRMTHVKTRCRRIRELDQTIELGSGIAGDGGVGLRLFPLFLPFCLDGCKIVFHNRLLCLVINTQKRTPLTAVQSGA